MKIFEKSVSVGEIVVRVQAESSKDKREGLGESAARLENAQGKAQALRGELKALRQQAERAAEELQNHKGPDGFFAKLFDFGSSAEQLENKRHKAESANIAAEEKKVEVEAMEREQKDALQKLHDVLDSAELAMKDLGQVLKDETQRSPVPFE
ncbi:MAG: hypothetical protein HY791_15570 [Deltaproteobacteria bacterium]|nr:hypothetical protein [Deltaproteobacteria bacterium]